MGTHYPTTIVAVPYDSGHRARRMGAGPLHLLDHGVADLVAERGASVNVEIVEPTSPWVAEIGTAFDLARSVARHVHTSVEDGRFPVVLSGNCSATLGGVAGVTTTDDDLGVVWLDAHGDLNTPESTMSGFLDGMALAAVMGQCWNAMSASVPGFRPIDASRVALVGARDLDPSEQALIDKSALHAVTADALRSGLTGAMVPALVALKQAGVKRVYLHLDVDVHDPELARANAFRAPGGPSPDDVQVIVRLVAELFAIVGVTVSAYDPAYDPDGVMRGVAMRLVDEVVTLASR